jgi:hypothetical protein
MMDPELQALLQQLLAAPPEYDSKGRPKPYSLTEAAKRTNFQQDQMQNMANPMYAIFSGQGSFDPQDFADVPAGEEKYQIPDDPLAAYLQLPDKTSDESVIADMVKQGAAPSSVVAKFKKNGVTDEKQLAKIEKQAQGLFDAHAKYRSVMSTLPGISVDENGDFQLNGDGKIVGNQLIIPKYERSPAAQAFDKAGLPTPDQTFSPEDFYKGDAGASDLAQKVKQLTQVTDASKRAVDQTRVADPAARDPRIAQLLALRANAEPHGGGGVDVTKGTPMEQQYARSMMANHPQAPIKNGTSAAYDRAVSAKPGARTPVRAGGNQHTAQRAAEDKYSHDMRSLRIAENSLKDATATDKQRQAYAQRMAELHQQNGITPLALMALKRAQGML